MILLCFMGILTCILEFLGNQHSNRLKATQNKHLLNIPFTEEANLGEL